MATAALLGVPSVRLLTGDPLEHDYWRVVFDKALELDEIRQQNLAVLVGNELAKHLTELFRRLR